MSIFHAIKKVAQYVFFVLLASIVIPVVVSVCLPAVVALSPIAAVVFAYKIFASLCRTQKRPRFQLNSNLPLLAPFEFVDTDKEFSKPAKVFLSTGVLLALIILYPLIITALLIESVFNVVCLKVLKMCFKKLKEVAFGSLEIDNSAMREVKIDDSVKQNLKSLEDLEGVVFGIFDMFDSLVNLIKNNYTDSGLEDAGARKYIEEFYIVKNACCLRLRNSGYSKDDIDVKKFEHALTMIVFIVSFNPLFSGREELKSVKKYEAGTFTDSYFALCDAYEKCERDRASTVPSKKLDGVNQNSAVGIGESLILR